MDEAPTLDGMAMSFQDSDFLDEPRSLGGWDVRAASRTERLRRVNRNLANENFWRTKFCDERKIFTTVNSVVENT